MLTFKEERSTTEFPGLLRLLEEDGAGDADASLRENFRAPRRFAARASVGDDLKLVFEAQHRRQVHDFFDCPEYWHVAHYTVKDKDKKILFKIKWSSRRIPWSPSRAPIPTGWRRKCSTAKRPSKASTTRRALPTRAGAEH